MVKVLVTGAAGFIGGYLITRGEYEWLPVSRTPYLGCLAVGDMAMYDNWHNLFSDIDAVVHLAAKVHQHESSDLNAYTPDNVEVVKRMAEAAASRGVKRFIFLSSIKVNGESTKGAPFKPSDAPAPLDPYGESKVLAETILLDIAAKSDLEVVIIRPPLVYGPKVKANFQSLWQLSSTKLPLPFGVVDNRRDMISVYNLCDIIERCIHAPEVKNKVLLVSDGRPYSLAGIIRAMRKVRGRSAGLIPIPKFCLQVLLTLVGKRAMASRLLGDLEVDISETKTLLNWQPTVTLEQTLERMLND